MSQTDLREWRRCVCKVIHPQQNYVEDCRTIRLVTGLLMNIALSNPDVAWSSHIVCYRPAASAARVYISASMA